jgi:hypothetical protein
MHEVENTSSVPSDFFRIEFKTEAPESALLRGRFERFPLAVTSKVAVQFENAQLRVTRAALLNDVFAIDETAPYPSVVVDTDAGAVHWVGPRTSFRVAPLRSRSSDLLRFELKTAPRRGN